MRCVFLHIVFSLVSFTPLLALSALVDSDGDQVMSDKLRIAGQNLMRRERTPELSHKGVQARGSTEEMQTATISPHAFFTQSHGFTKVHPDAAASGSAPPQGAVADAAAAGSNQALSQDKKEKGDDDETPADKMADAHDEDSADKKPDKHTTHIKAQHMVQNSKSTLKTAVTDALKSGEEGVSEFVAGGVEIASEVVHKMKDGSAAESASADAFSKEAGKMKDGSVAESAPADAFSKEALLRAQADDAEANKAETHVFTKEEEQLVKEVQEMHLVDSDQDPDRVWKAHQEDSFEMRVSGPTGELCLGHRSKDLVQAWTCEGHKAQQWFWSTGNTKHLMNLKSDTHCLGYISEKTEVNDGLIMYPCRPDDESPLMNWIIDEGSRLVTESTGKCMALPELEDKGQYQVVTLPCGSAKQPIASAEH